MAKTDTNRRSPKNPGSFLMGLAAVLFCLVAVSTYLMGGLYARYATQGQSADSARVAKFDISMDKPEDIQIEYRVTPGDAADYILTFHNKSEVAVSYSIKVDVKKADFDIKISLGGFDLNTSANATLDFGEVGQIPAGTDQTENLTFSVLDWKKFTELTSAARRDEPLDFTVYITVTQVD